VLEFNFNWKKLSAAADITFRNFHFRIYEHGRPRLVTAFWQKSSFCLD
jgi:hypothetical protein